MCSYNQLNQLNVICKCLTSKSANTLVVPTILFKLDFCNAILFGISDNLLNKLQLLQNACARLCVEMQEL